MNKQNEFYPFLGEIKYINKTAYVICGAGLINIYFEGAKQLLKHSVKDIDTVKFEFQTQTITINKHTTIEEVYDMLSPEPSIEEQINNKNRLDEDKKLSDQSYSTMIQALKKVTPIDLVSGETDISTVLDFSKQISQILANAKDVIFTDEKAKELAYELIKIGCVSTDSIHSKYLSSEKNLTIQQLAKRRDVIDAPANFWSNIITGRVLATSIAINQLSEILSFWSNPPILQTEKETI